MTEPRFIFDDDELHDGVPAHLYFQCPRRPHRCAVALRPNKQPNGASWEWDGNREAPTLTPSISCGACGWHGWIRGGELVDA
jgi:hypothetical protein